MGSFSEEKEDLFFDTLDRFSFVSDSGSDCCSSSNLDKGFLDYLQYQVWCESPESVDVRRHRFLKWMALSSEATSITRENSGDSCNDNIKLGIDRVTEVSGAVLRASSIRDGSSLNQSLVSCGSNHSQESVENHALEEFASLGKNSVGQTEFVTDELDQDGPQSFSREVRMSQSDNFEERPRFLASPLVDQLLHKEVDEGRPFINANMKVKKSWLSKLAAVANFVDRHREVASKPGIHESASGARTERVRVHPYSKRSKELSSLYVGQEFMAHEGSIYMMKFSLDGQYLASAGEDGIVRVWKIVEDERLHPFDIQGVDSSCLYFTMNNLSQLAPLNVGKEEIDKVKRLRKLSDSTCVIFPPKLFRILEKPVHEFQGHSGAVLDLSWSKKGFLLSSSIDKTVRLWQVGHDRCLRVFHHNDYVTSVAFNPVDDNYFISGSLDGKVRIWKVLRCRVVDYTDIRDIVTAVCYRPDGKGGIVGSMTGNCRFYDIIDNRLKLQAEVFLQGKKKSPGKRITGFQFCPSDPSKLIITSADSLVRVLSGVNVIYKLKASSFRITTSHMFATFTRDGKHIISASEDSHIYAWNYANQDKTSSRTTKDIWSCESFMSPNTSFAIPWCGIETMTEALQMGDMQRSSLANGQKHHSPKLELEQKMLHSSLDCFSVTRIMLESLMRGPATWPEETLPDASPAAATPEIGKSELKILKSACQSMLSSPHMWGLVIVTASSDGRIKTYHNYGLPIRL